MRLLALALLVLFAGRPARAQAVLKAGDPETTVQNIYRGLFAGITLPTETKDSAMRVIRNENNVQLALDGRAPGSWGRRIALNRGRDSALRTLLRSDADRKAFDANSERLRPHGSTPQ